MGSPSGSRLPARRLPEGPRLRAGWSSWEVGQGSFCRGTGCARSPCPRDRGDEPAGKTIACGGPARPRPAAERLHRGRRLRSRAPPRASGGPARGRSRALVPRGLGLSLPRRHRAQRLLRSGRGRGRATGASDSLGCRSTGGRGGPPRGPARRGVTAMAVVALVVAVAIAPWPAAPVGWAFLALVVTRGAMLFAPLWTEPGGPTTGRAIGGGILMIPLFDATFVAAAGQAPWAFAVASLMLPAMALRRMYSPT